MDLVFVGIGGALGSLARYKLGIIIARKTNTKYPLGTFIINISGAILLGIVSSFDAGKNTYLLLGDGFLGAYTTFSTFMYEGFNLFNGNKKKNAVTYILGSFLFGITGYIAGFEIGTLLK